LTFAPGVYRFSGRGITVHRAGRAGAPITLRAETPGTVTLEFELLEGIHVSAPHWVFENLTIVGVCRDHGACEHAFHVVGGATHVVIRNNDLRDFNAHVKINGSGGRFPDDGRIEGNRITNAAPRATDAPVTPIDIVAASGWRIEGNLIADFVKAGGDRTSYGGFAKGGGGGNVFARNVVLCEHRLRGADGGKGRRVGLSFGGGGSDLRACRDGRCAVEHERGVMRENLIASCSDEGIYINRAAQTQLVHNTVLDTAGISVRFGESAVQLAGNLSDAPIRVRDGATTVGENNLTSSLPAMYSGLSRVRAMFANADELDLRWANAAPLNEHEPGAGVDLCGEPRPAAAAYGAFEDIGRCAARPGR
jgi:nitrous oxidase accessory protein NosD